MKNRLHRDFRIIGGILLGVMLSACVQGQRPPPPRTNAMGQGAIGGAVVVGTIATTVSGGLAVPLSLAVGSVVGGAIGSEVEASKSTIEKVRHQGIDVIRVGDEVTLILPTDQFFHPYSPVLQADHEVVLDIIADYIRSEAKIMVTVAGYTDNYGTPLRALALSKQRAQSIVDYLWRSNIDARVLAALGYGQDNPIATNLTREGRAHNRRIEIKMTTLPA